MNSKRNYYLLSGMGFGFAFLYVPILLLMVFSFNEAKITTKWSRFSFKWYQILFENDAIINAALISLRIAIISATVATIIGTMAGIALVRFGKFKGKTFFSGLMVAPMVMPEVITGLSLLLLFVALEEMFGWPDGRGMTTITLAHITFCIAFVAVIIQSRLQGMDESLEEAAMDLGGRPVRVLFDITLPLIAPAMISGWLLSFTLSLDDVILASFVSGPGSTTLPLVVFSKVKLGVSPDINALATIIIIIVTVGVLLAGWSMNKKEKAYQRDIQIAIAANE
jgi:putrescine transport system permease protein